MFNITAWEARHLSVHLLHSFIHSTNGVNMQYTACALLGAEDPMMEESKANEQNRPDLMKLTV